MLLITFTVTYRPATDHNGARYIVRNTQSGERVTVAYDYSAPSPNVAAVRQAFPRIPSDVTIQYSGDHNGVAFYTAIWNRDNVDNHLINK